ncbi:uncharacterized protein N7498_006877 [Penicillium cinerascens]|uniref:Membrane anchor Opy2 N-terminal domain-containing protein n=1 Tax=Penicillium cinerascens TaxID=70096 RepID=A0A9W9JMN8_9EURO|nr:uncharacterized protein N7498_006877 [Penicillium cinerascens]KAJ5197760.1 hypothetical protein N7498_006877 [Penicillium cinerascens]
MLPDAFDSAPTSPDSGFLPSNSLFKRCISCGPSAPTCPSCPDGTTCTMTSQTCDSCATTKCISTGNTSAPPSSGPNVGAIAGGVVGAVIALAALLFLIWWFVIRPRRDERKSQQEKSGAFAAQRSERKSTQSIASTVLTRASNVIQIAYIPGVTNRSPPETPASLVPPVPPLPGATPDQHFFMPGDLRDSSWTATTGHQSISPTLRSSVATTIYRNDAIVSAMPAQQIQRSRANIVSVHNGPGGSGDSTPTQSVPVMITPRDAPAVPAITPSQLAKAEAMQGAPGSSIVARQVVAKPVMVRGPSVKKKDGQSITETGAKDIKPTTADSANSSRQFDHHTSTFNGNSSDEDDDTRPSTPSNSTGEKVSASANEESPSRGPFSDQASSSNATSGNTRRSSLHAGQAPPPRVQSPFSDANEVP